MKSYVSAIRAILAEIDIEINENHYLLTSLTKACRYKNNRVITRVPIHVGMLKIILRSINNYFSENNQNYLRVLYKAIFAISYYGLFRIGELTTGSHPVAARDVHIGLNKNKLLFILRTSKTHWKDVKPQTVKISSTNTKKNRNNSEFCPYAISREYLKHHKPYKTNAEPFFVFSDRSPVAPHHVRTVFKRILEINNFDLTLYTLHSFRVGRASDLLKGGFSVETIKKLGRWKSNSVYAYLR